MLMPSPSLTVTFSNDKTYVNSMHSKFSSGNSIYFNKIEQL